MSFTESIKRCMGKKYASIQGRAPMSEFWWFFLYVWGVLAILVLTISGIGSSFNQSRKVESVIGIVALIWWVVHIIPYLCVLVRRFHDSDTSGMNLFWLLVPYFGPIWILVIAISSKSPGINKYGYPYPQNDIRFTEQDYALLSMKLNQANMEVHGAPPCVYGYKCIPLEAIPFIQDWEAQKAHQTTVSRSNNETNIKNQYTEYLPNQSNEVYSKENPKEITKCCPSCGSPVREDGASFCWKCGSPLTEQT